MIKGVNRQIIEINDTGNVYFERALLIVRPGFVDVSHDTLGREARDMVKNSEGYTGMRLANKQQKVYKLIQCSIAAAIGMLAGAFTVLLFR